MSATILFGSAARGRTSVCLTLLLWMLPVTAFAVGTRDEDTGQNEAAKSPPANRLAKETSPYLLMHAHNPVDWYPWGPEALRKAREENKPIFLSIGYSSCYWCHVMERRVFMNEEIASYMNEHFINIKVDREERPDLDDIYMTALLVYQQMAGGGGGGGWPLSLFLTPDGKPFVGATYLPPQDVAETGQPGFLSVAGQVQTVWETREDDLRRSADLIAMEVRRLLQPMPDAAPSPPTPELIADTLAAIQSRFDPEYGGVGFNPRTPDGPKFPNPVRLDFLVTLLETREQPDAALVGIDYAAAEEMLSLTLSRMARGGIRDHLGGGFHRYSTDRRWHVPHFEKMLYDQAQLAEVYARAGAVLQEPAFTEVAREINADVLHLFRQDSGGFSSALDAETNAIEGEYYIWSKAEVREALDESAYSLFAKAFGLEAPNPFEHGIVLHQPQPLEITAAEANISPDALKQSLEESRRTLLALRRDRERPLLDDKVLAAWNGLMIESMAVTGPLLNDPATIKAAEDAARFVLTHLKDDEGRLMRTWRQGQAKHRAFLDDYALLSSALLALHRATGEEEWLSEARRLTDQQIELFHVPGQSAFAFTPSDHEDLLARTANAFDSIFASGNSVTIRNLQQLAQHTEDGARYAELAESTLARFTEKMKESPTGTTGMALAAIDWLTNRNSDAATASAGNNPVPPNADPAEANADCSDNPAAERPGDEATTKRQDESLQLAGTSDASDKALIETLFGDNRSGSGIPESPTSVGAEGKAESRIAFRPVTPPDDPADADDDKKNRPVQARAFLLYEKLRPGTKCPVALEVTIKDKWHINANPPFPDYHVPTDFEVESEDGVRMTRVKYPKHKLLRMEGADEEVHVYGKKVTIYGLLEIPRELPPDGSVLELKLSFQACNEKACLRPDSIVLRGKIPVASPGEKVRRINVEKFQPKKKSRPEDGKENSTAGQ